MIEKRLQEDWLYWMEQDSFALVWNIPQNARTISLPHDAMIENEAYEKSPNGGNTGFRDGGNYNYAKLLEIPSDACDKEIYLKFEGVYENAFVYVNGQLAGKNPYGYSVFYVDIKNYVRFGEKNEIRVIVRNGAMTNSRWYSGGGIYRDVYLCIGESVHISSEGVFVTSESADEEYAVVTIKTELKNSKNQAVKTVLESKIMDEEGTVVASESIPVTLFAGEERTMEQRIIIAKPRLWSDLSPNLYRCESELSIDGTVVDKNVAVFGIRMLSLDAKRGLRVNGRPCKLRGACIHHDSGLLGAATYEDAQYRQIRILKEAGFNAIRMSHQPIAPAMLRACDEIGVYVMDETFDMWTRAKSDHDYSMNFNEYWEKDVTSMVRKDYNHPSVILYSVGNEIPEIGTDLGAKICHDICAKIKSLDQTRYTLASINGVFMAGDKVEQITKDIIENLDESEKISGNVNNFMTLMDSHLDEIVVHPIITQRLEKACAATDIAGYNYMTARYEEDGKNYPNRIIVGSETYPPEIARNWEIIKKSDHVIGDFTWTGWDYIGEAGVGIPAYQWGEGGFGAKFPSQLAYVGDIDLTGVRRPASYYREIVFGLQNRPYITVQNPEHKEDTLIKTPWVISDSQPCWTYPGKEGNQVIVEVYSAGTEVELYLDDSLIGRKPCGSENEYRALFEVTYEPGQLKAVAYDGDRKIGESVLNTTGDLKQIALRAEALETIKYRKTTDRLLFVPITLCDESGNLVMHQDQKVHVTVEGGATLLGFGSGNPKPAYNYIQEMTETFYGRALLILKKKQDQQDITIKITSESGLQSELIVTA
ncbi:beta-galactosidase [Lachnospiraceae bacterium KM106-2]|nr:beta-galactosidase [Lachnospiraceae bacterium KM106-2]